MLRLDCRYFFPACTWQFQIINCRTECLIILIPACTYFISHFLSGFVGRLWPALPPGRHHSVQANRRKGHVLQSGRICQSPQHHQGPLQRISPAGEGGIFKNVFLAFSLGIEKKKLHTAGCQACRAHARPREGDIASKSERHWPGLKKLEITHYQKLAEQQQQFLSVRTEVEFLLNVALENRVNKA